MKRPAIIVSLIFLQFFFSVALGQELAYKNYTASDGLASDNVYCAIQDNNGFMWFGTDNGASCFDGKKFKNYYAESGLGDRDIVNIIRDNYGRLWFITFNGKVSYYENGKIYNSANTAFLKNVEIKSNITALFVDSKKNLWIAYANYKTIKVTASGKITVFLNLTASIIWEDKNEKIHALYAGSIYTYNGSCFTYHEFGRIMLRQEKLLDGDTSILVLGTVTKENVTSKSLLGLYNIKTNRLYVDSLNDYSSTPTIKSFFIDHEKNVWLSSLKGVSKYTLHNLLGIRNANVVLFPNIPFSRVFQDKNDNYWFASLNKGVFMVTSLNIHLFDVNTGLIENNITSLAVMPDSSIILGSQNGNIQLIKNGVVKNKEESLIPQLGKIISIQKDIYNQVWILTDIALFKYKDGSIFKLNDPGSFYKSLFISNKGTIWIGTGNGLKKVYGDEVVSIFRGDINRVYSIAQGKNDTLWLGTELGLFVFKDGIMRQQGQDSLLRNKINALAFAPDSTLWIATNNNGVLHIKKNKEVNHYTVIDGLLSNYCNNLLMDSDRIYLSTNKGLNILNIQNEKATILSYTSGNGLVSNHVNQVIKKNNNVFFLATDKGIIEFNPNKLPPSAAKSPYIESISINDIKRPAEYLRNLNYSENNLQIDFGAIDFNNSGNDIIYHYQLSGLDTGWNYTTSHSVKYNHLQPGKYTFIVKTENGPAKSNVQTASFNLFIKTPFWQTWWFRSIVAISLVVIVILIVRNRINAYVSKINQQKKAAESELKALRAQINPHFIYNSLNSIQDFIMQNQKQDANLYLSKFATLMRSILSHSRASDVTLSEEINSLQLYLELESLVSNEQFSFNFELDKQLNAEEIKIPSMILQPYIENAILHGLATIQKNGRLIISFTKKDNYLLCTIEDNGIGRKKAAELKQQKVWKNRPSLGMQVTQERIDLINTYSQDKITLEIIDLINNDNTASGTRVNVSFPFVMSV